MPVWCFGIYASDFYRGFEYKAQTRLFDHPDSLSLAVGVDLEAHVLMTTYLCRTAPKNR